jgi:hypothetical protein
MRSLLLVAALALMPTEAAFADKPGPDSTYKQKSADGRFVFVMLAPVSLEEEVSGVNPQYAPTLRALRTQYTKSGLYKNDGSKDPLWTVDWYKRPVVVADDGVHLVAFGRWAYFKEARTKPPDMEALKREALSFYAKGKLLRTYSIGELVDTPGLLPRSVSHFRWLKSSALLDISRQFEVITHDGNRVLFELSTGKLLNKAPVRP